GVPCDDLLLLSERLKGIRNDDRFCLGLLRLRPDVDALHEIAGARGALVDDEANLGRPKLLGGANYPVDGVVRRRARCVGVPLDAERSHRSVERLKNRTTGQSRFDGGDGIDGVDGERTTGDVLFFELPRRTASILWFRAGATGQRIPLSL